MARRKALTIDDLAAETGASSRSIRYYQTRGLLPPPRVKGRTGYYDERHVERLKLIGELQEEGLNLQAIGWLLAGASGVDSEELRRLKRAVLDGWASEQPVVLSRDQLVAALAGEEWDADTAARAERAGLVHASPEGTGFEVLMPTILAAGGELAALGVPLDRLIHLLETMREAAQRVAESYVELFDEAVLAPWDARGRPEAEWSELRELVERLRPLAGEALLAVFRRVMGEVITDALSRFMTEE